MRATVKKKLCFLATSLLLGLALPFSFNVTTLTHPLATLFSQHNKKGVQQQMNEGSLMAHGLKSGLLKTQFCGLYFALNAATTLTTSVDGRHTTCPGERVTYTCMVTQSAVLEWTAEPFINSTNRRQFSRTTPPEDRVLACSDSASDVNCTEFDYTATVTSIKAFQNGFADMVSTFTFTASARVNGTVVQCRGSGVITEHQMANHTLNVTGGMSILSVY